MTEQEKKDDKLKKEQQVERLKGLLDPVAGRFIADLGLLHSIKKEQEKVLNERIKERFGQLKYQVLMFLFGKIQSSSPEDLKKISGIYWRDGGETVELLPFIIGTSFGFRFDKDGQRFALAGSDHTPTIKMEDIILRGIADSNQDIIELLSRVSGYLEGIAKIEYQPIEGGTDKFRVSYNLSGLIHENAKSLQS